jgi:thiamine monophosphate kinase
MLAHELNVELTRIGRFEGEPDDMWLQTNGQRQRLVPRGWEHFR